MTLQELLAQANDLANLTDEALTELDAAITTAAEEVAADTANLDDQALADLEAAGAAVQSIRDEQATREQDAQDRAARAQAALALVRGETNDPDGDDGEAADESDDTDGDESEDEGQEGGESGEPGAAPATPEGTATPDAPEGAEAEPIAAAVRPRPRLAPVAARRPPSTRPRQSVTASANDLTGFGLVAAAGFGDVITAGAPIRDYGQLGYLIAEAFQTAQGYTVGPKIKVPIARVGRGVEQYPESHRMSDSPAANTRTIQRIQQSIQAAGGLGQALRDGVTASGGICAPGETRYDLPVVGDDARPVRDRFMTRVGAERGAIETLPIPLIEDLDGSVDFWTEANDRTPGSDGPAVKPCLTITCPDDNPETIVEAVTRCLKWGNFRARYFPEQIEAWLRLSVVHQAREAEQRLLATVAAGANADVTVGQTLGTTRDLLAGLDRVLAVWRYRHRLADTFMLDWALPRWIREQIRSDIARQLPVGSLNETFIVSDAQINAWFAARSVEPVWLMDGESGQRFNVQGDGALQGWPSTVKTYLAPSGGWLFMDGGELNLGIMRDPTLTGTNDAQFFVETFEGAHFHGPENWTVTFDTCPDGSVSATVDIAPCTTGS